MQTCQLIVLVHGQARRGLPCWLEARVGHGEGYMFILSMVLMFINQIVPNPKDKLAYFKKQNKH